MNTDQSVVLSKVVAVSVGANNSPSTVSSMITTAPTQFATVFMITYGVVRLLRVHTTMLQAVPIPTAVTMTAFHIGRRTGSSAWDCRHDRRSPRTARRGASADRPRHD